MGGALGLSSLKPGAVSRCASYTALLTAVLPGSTSGSSSAGFVGQPRVESLSATCASIEFLYSGDSKSVDDVYIFAKEPFDGDFSIRWGASVKVFDVSYDISDDQYIWDEMTPQGQSVTRFRILMRELPPGRKFQVVLSDQEEALLGEGLHFSEPSAYATSDATALPPATPSHLQLHRSDPRLNFDREDKSLCVDLHWSHPHLKLSNLPDDVLFRIFIQYAGEDPRMHCEDQLMSRTRNCGASLDFVTTEMPSMFATICGLRPKREVKFIVEAFNCDSKSVSASIQAVTPPSAPSVTAWLVTQAPSQGSQAGFRPTAVIDWVPQHDDLIVGHAIYLALKSIGSMKLLCWEPHGSGRGHLELPVIHKNNTYSSDAPLLRDYALRYHVHQEQEILVATRTNGNLESPLYSFSLGEWLIIEESVKCLTSFDAVNPTYAAYPVTLSWTQEQALSLYD
ncbi:unnamed protein product [Polarella glacialis]|uniref:Uncharacterized protein n=1 Tax=Polarella glacialis TaxID=89957 RepID=A0A813GX22_POLGL|nr:unnamed protein product [Polarella glacialis]